MALTATIYTLDIELADADRHVDATQVVETPDQRRCASTWRSGLRLER